MRVPLLWLGTTLLTGCDGGRRGGDDAASDARLITDIYTWPCDADDGSGEMLYSGVYGHTISLEYAPGALRDMDLPEPGECAYGLDLFPASAGSGGADIAGVGADDPAWEMAHDSDLLDRLSPGFWFDDILETFHSCSTVAAHMTGGLTLRQAGSLSGAAAPEAASAPLVTFSGYEAEIKWGDPVSAAWEGGEWDQVWVQLRREQGDLALETVTCNVSGQSSFTADDAVWDQLDSLLAVQRTNLYVAFQNQDSAQTDADETIDLLSRAIAAAALPE